MTITEQAAQYAAERGLQVDMLGADAAALLLTEIERLDRKTA